VTRIGCLLAVLLAVAAPVRAEQVWLVVAASARTPMEIVAASKVLIAREPEGLVVQNSDCGDAKRMYAWVAAIATSAEAAQTRLAQVRQTVKDAYIKR
jgi:hypothetical protein